VTFRSPFHLLSSESQAQYLSLARAGMVSDMATPTTRRQVAVHEAGHLVVAAALGAPPRRARIWQETQTPLREWHGENYTEHPANWVSRRAPPCGSPLGLVSEGLIEAAGPLAEQLFVQEARSEWNRLNDAPEMAVAVAKAASGLFLSWPDAQAAQDEWEKHASVIQVAAHALIGHVCADLLIGANMSVVALVADKLTTHGRLARHEIAPLVRDVAPVSLSSVVATFLASAPDLMRMIYRVWGLPAAVLPASFKTLALLDEIPERLVPWALELARSQRA